MRTFGIGFKAPTVSKHRIFMIVAGGAGVGLGLTAAAACSAALLVTAPLGAARALKEFLTNPTFVENSDFELGSATIAFALGDAIVHGADYALGPIKGSIDVAILGGRIMVNAE